MHRLALLAALAGCISEKTKPCKNGAVCPYDEACTEVPLTSNEPLCGSKVLVNACAGKLDTDSCDFADNVAGACHGGICHQCTDDIAGCPVDGWKQMTSPTGVTLNAVWGVAGEAYAVGDDSTVLHYDGLRWQAADGFPELGVGIALRGIWGSDLANVYVVAGTGKIYRFDGSAWGEVFASQQGLNAIWGTSTNAIDAVGGNGVIAHFDGITWADSVPTVAAPFNAVWGSSASNVFAVSNFGLIVRYDTSWQVQRPANAMEPSLSSVWGRSATEAFAVGAAKSGSNDPTILHWDGSQWSVPTLPVELQPIDLFAVAGNATRVFAVGRQGTILQFDGTWTSAGSSGQGTLRGIGGDDEVLYAVGESGRILRYTGN